MKYLIFNLSVLSICPRQVSAYVQFVTFDILLHKYAPKKNECPANRRTLLDDAMSQSELTTVISQNTGQK